MHYLFCMTYEGIYSCCVLLTFTLPFDCILILEVRYLISNDSYPFYPISQPHIIFVGFKNFSHKYLE